MNRDSELTAVLRQASTPEATSVGDVLPEAPTGSRIAAWLCLIGLIIPAWEAAFFVGGVKFTVGRLGVVVLLAPAIHALFQPNRKFILADGLMVAMACWMLAAGAAAPNSLSSSAAEAIELAGGYFVARAFFYGLGAVKAFVDVLKIVTLASVILGAVDRLANRNIAHQIFAAMSGTPPVNYMIRDGIMRVSSTLDHPILFGSFCCIAATILLQCEPTRRGKVIYVGAALFGLYLARSSSSILGLAVVLFGYSYNLVMKRISRRWLLLWLALGPLIVAFFASANSPLGWIFSHLTLDPASGWFRLIIWDRVLSKLPDSPYFGFGFVELGDYILDTTVDSVWLVIALRFGVPAVALLLLLNGAVALPTGFRPHDALGARKADFALAFSMSLVVYVLIGLTVHYWNFTWILWGLCLGIRGSLQELLISSRRQTAHELRNVEAEWSTATC